MIYILTVKEENVVKAFLERENTRMLKRYSVEQQIRRRPCCSPKKTTSSRLQQDLLDKAVSKLHEAQSLILKARLRMKNEERI